MLNLNLLVCPHCGSVSGLRVASRLGPVDSEGYKHTEYYVYCDPKVWGTNKGCGAQGGAKASWDDAVQQWNMRFS